MPPARPAPTSTGDLPLDRATGIVESGAGMHSAHDLLEALAIVLAVAAVTSVLFEKLRQPVVLGYILAGLIVGPHLPIPLVADREIVQTLSELGVILLMFGLGLEFSVRKLVRVGPTAGLTAFVETSIMLWLGFLAGRALGWTPIECVFTGAIVAISSTTIVAKVLDDLQATGALRDLVVGVLLAEDLLAVLLMALLTTIATGASLSADTLGVTVGKLLAFLFVILVSGMLVVPRAIRYVARLGRHETLLVASLGLCFGVALLALAAGYSVALGAFIAGSLIAESGEGHQIARLVKPVRDLFAAVFFVSVGMLIDPALVAEHWRAAIALLTVVVVGKACAVSLGAFLTGHGIQTSIRAGMSLTQIGEFSFILATLGSSLGATRDFLFPIAVCVSAITTLTTPLLIGASGAAAALVDRKLPPSLQTVLSLYGSWLEQIRTGPRRRTIGARVQRLVRVLLIDSVLLTGIVIGTSLGFRRITAFLGTQFGLTDRLARPGLVSVAALAALPLCLGLVRNGRRLGLELASAALPVPVSAAPGTDLAAAPRNALVATFQLGATVLVLLPIVAVTQPFLPGVPGTVLLGAAILVLGVGFWRSAANLQGHVSAGALVMVEAIAHQARPATESREATKHVDVLSQFRAMFPGMGEPVLVRMPASSPCIGKTISELGIRGTTGATVLVISRDQGSVTLPTASERLLRDDVLALAGTHQAVEAARELLHAELVS